MVLRTFPRRVRCEAASAIAESGRQSNKQARIIKTRRTVLKLKALPNGCNQKHRGKEDCDAHVLISGLSRFRALLCHLRSFLVQTKELLVLCVVIVRHEDRTRRRLRVVERVGL